MRNIDLHKLPNCYQLAEINVNSKNKNFYSHDGCLYSKDKSILYRYPIMKKDEQYNPPKALRKIMPESFKNNSFLQSMKFTGKLTYIGSSAFQNCSSLSSFYISSTSPPNCDETIFKKTKVQIVYVPFSFKADKFCGKNTEVYFDQKTIGIFVGVGFAGVVVVVIAILLLVLLKKTLTKMKDEEERAKYQ